MTRAGRLKRIVKLADVRTRSASLRLAESRQKRDEAQLKLQQFELYREEYQRALGAGGEPISASQAVELRRFIAQIDQAISALTQQSTRSAQQYDDDLAAWGNESQRTRALGEVMDRAQRDDDHSAENRAQREVDDRRPANK